MPALQSRYRNTIELLLLLLVAFVGFFGSLGLGFAFGTFFAFDFFLALLDDFGLGRSRAFGGNDFGGLLFFCLETDDVREYLLRVTSQLSLAGIQFEIARA